MQATATISSVSGSCTTSPKLQGATTWELRYRKKNSAEWITLSSQTGDTFDVTINDLTQATEYEIEFRFLNDIGTSNWGKIEAKTDSDLNGDGILDLSQPHVSAHVNPQTGNFVAIDMDSDCVFTSVNLVRESELSAQDAAYSYDNGLFNFAADCSIPTTTVHLYYYGVSKKDLLVRKYNPGTQAFFNVTGKYGATLQESTINGQLVTDRKSVV